jgi:hypothetical protein
MDPLVKFVLLMVAIAILVRLAKGAAREAGVPAALTALALGSVTR